MASTRHVTIGDLTLGNDRPLTIIAGPCALESRAHALEMSQALAGIAAKLGIGLIYKTSFDKANRTSLASGRGVGLEVRALNLNCGDYGVDGGLGRRYIDALEAHLAGQDSFHEGPHA